MNFIKELTKLKKSQDKRLEWTEYFMSITILISTRSSCNRLHVGSIIVKDNRILSTGYNGFLQGLPHESIVVNGHEQATTHAEHNSIAQAAKTGISVAGATCYITHFPCVNCTKLLLMNCMYDLLPKGKFLRNIIKFLTRNTFNFGKYKRNNFFNLESQLAEAKINEREGVKILYIYNDDDEVFKSEYHQVRINRFFESLNLNNGDFPKKYIMKEFSKDDTESPHNILLDIVLIDFIGNFFFNP